MARPDPSISSQGKGGTQVVACLAFRFLVAVDVEGFSRCCAARQAKIQDDLEYAMSQAAASANLDRRRWYRQPRGDGELAVLPPGTNGLSLVADYPHRLAQVLAEINRPANPGSRLRVRMAIHHGTVASGRFGPVGGAPTLVSRLVDAEMLRQKFRRRDDHDIALIVSATVYEEVIQSRFSDLNPEMFGRANIRVKGVSYVGYLYHGAFVTQDSRVSTTARNITAPLAAQ